jgi:hypothetical protein
MGMSFGLSPFLLFMSFIPMFLTLGGVFFACLEDKETVLNRIF